MSGTRLRVVFIGTPAFAVPSLELLAGVHEVVEVVTQPDRPAGRGRRLQAPPVKQAARELGVPVFQPARIGDPEAWERLARHRPDVIGVVGYGQMIPRRIRELPPHGCVNVHSSLLPKYRGAAPVNWAIARGETRTGVTTMRIVRKMDAGDILLVRETRIDPDETASALNRRLAPMGAELLAETLDGLASGTVQPIPQDHGAATRAPLLRREDGLVDWSSPAQSVYDRLRGFDPWPGIHTHVRGKRLRIWSARPVPSAPGRPGRLQVGGSELGVECGEGLLVLEQVQLEGRKSVSAMDFARGFRLAPDEVLGHE